MKLFNIFPIFFVTECKKIKCSKKDKGKKKVCGSDGNTYKNRCAMKRAACKAGVKITKKPNKQCKDKPGKISF